MTPEYRALMKIRALLAKPRDYSHPPSIATLLDEIEAARILRALADKLENMHSGLDNSNRHDGVLFDANGNRCGTWEAKPRRIRD